MADLALSFEGDAELIAEIAEIARESGIRHSNPVATKSPADALDAPFTPAEIEQAIRLLSVLLTAGSATIMFIDKLESLLKKRRKRVVVRDPKTGRVRAQIDGDSKPEQVREALDP